MTDVAKVMVINQLGQKVYDGSFSDGQGTKTIDIKSWSPGLYLYKINSEKGFSASGSFVIKH